MLRGSYEELVPVEFGLIRLHRAGIEALACARKLLSRSTSYNHPICLTV